MGTTRRGFLKGLGAVTGLIVASPTALIEMGAPPIRYQGPPLEAMDLTWTSVTGEEIIGYSINGHFNKISPPVTPNGGDITLMFDEPPEGEVKLLQRDGIFFTEI